MSVPFLKWPGGKRWLLKSEQFSFPKSFNTYIEPFLGAGAVYLSLCPSIARLSDTNRDLIETFKVVRKNPEKLEEALREHQKRHTKEHYYQTRAQKPQDEVSRAARFLYLNRTCWNGLYRVNHNGDFNVPIGTKTSVLLPTDDFIGASKLLETADIRCCDFKTSIDLAGPNDFIFVDPPYTANHNKNGFLKYNENIFSWKDQIRLRNTLLEAKERGANIVVCNADHKSIRDLFSSIGTYQKVARHSVLSGKSHGRKPTTEAIFISWAL